MGRPLHFNAWFRGINRGLPDDLQTNLLDACMTCCVCAFPAGIQGILDLHAHSLCKHSAAAAVLCNHSAAVTVLDGRVCVPHPDHGCYLGPCPLARAVARGLAGVPGAHGPDRDRMDAPQHTALSRNMHLSRAAGGTAWRQRWDCLGELLHQTNPP
jgi:hypothetical protein